MSFFRAAGDFMLLLIARLFATQHFVQSFDDLAVFDGIRETQTRECVNHTTLLLVQDRCGSGLHIGKNLLRGVRPILDLVLHLVAEFVSENVFAPLQGITGFLRIPLHHVQDGGECLPWREECLLVKRAVLNDPSR